MGGKGAETFSNQSKASSEQARKAKTTQNSQGEGSEERRRMKLVKKIVEATQCSQAEAECALHDADNNADAAVLAIIEKAEEESLWTENKSRKARREEKADIQNSTGRGFRSSGRGGATNGERRGRVVPRGDGNTRSERPMGDAAGNEGVTHVNERGARRGRGSRGGGRGSGKVSSDRGRKIDNSENAPSDENSAATKSAPSEQDEFNWHNRNKDKPLVFTRSEQKADDKESATTSQADAQNTEKESVPEPVPFTGCAAGPISFAQAAAGRKRVVDPKVVPSEEAPAVKPADEVKETADDEATPEVYESALLSTPATEVHEEVEAVVESKNEEADIAELSLHDSSTSAEAHFEECEKEEPVEPQPEWADQPSNEPAVTSKVENEAVPEPKVQTFEMYKADTVSVVDTAPAHSKDDVYDSGNVQQRPLTNDQTCSGVPTQASDIPSDQSQDDAKNYISRQSNQQLSYGDTRNLSFPPEAYMQQPSRQQQQPNQMPSQQQAQPQSQHPVYPPHVPYGNFQYMNPMYPMGNMRSEDQYNAAAAFMHNYQSLMGFDMNALAAAAMNAAPGGAPQQHQQQPRHDNVYDHKSYHSANTVSGTGSNVSQQPRSDNASSMLPNAAVPPPPGFSGPPSNMSHYMQAPQQNLASLFAMPPQYPAQLPFSFLMPNVSGNSQQHKVPSHLPSFHQDDASSDLRLSGQQQKVYSQQNQMDKYGSNSQKVDRIGPNAQSTPPPQMGYGQQQYGNYMSQNQIHGSKKSYNHHNWNS